MKPHHSTLLSLPLAALTLAAAGAERDPFWPLGYAPEPPAKPEVAQPEAAPEPAPPPKPAPPAEKPVSESEWAKARKALSISGYTKSVRPDTREVRIVALINRQTYAEGDTVTLVRENVRFHWRVDAVTEKDIVLTPVRTERLSLIKPSPLKNEPVNRSANP